MRLGVERAILYKARPVLRGTLAADRRLSHWKGALHMEHPNLFDQLDASGRLRLPGADAAFGDLPWNPHPDFEGVELKHLITKRETGGQFSCHLVRVAPGKAIGIHAHPTQTELHEVAAGSGVCLSPASFPSFPRKSPIRWRRGRRDSACWPNSSRPFFKVRKTRCRTACKPPGSGLPGA